MSKENIIFIKDGKDITDYYYVDKTVDFCPLCNRKIKPYALLINEFENYDFDIIEVIYKCPSNDCKRLFIARYSKPSLEIYNNIYKFCGCVPFKIKEREFDKIIVDLSPNFVNIYNQAQIAEKYGLMQVCGMGYRKSLEFLIKDYCINNFPRDKEKIEQMPLSNCIKEYIKDENTKICAERAVWLGNDETHYKRLWEDKDIDDLKNLIELTLLFITSQALVEKYKTEMPIKKK